MATGYFIRKGDKTSCGGVVEEADNCVTIYDIAHAREGDRVTCGKDGKTYRISGGVWFIESHGRLVAGTLDSVSTCPCRAQLKASLFESSYETEDSPAPRARASVTPSNDGLTKKPQPDSASGHSTSPSSASTGVACDERFQFINHHHLPVGIADYAVLQDDQCIADGKLDAQGHSCSFNSAYPASLQLAISAPSPVKE